MRLHHMMPALVLLVPALLLSSCTNTTVVDLIDVSVIAPVHSFERAEMNTAVIELRERNEVIDRADIIAPIVLTVICDPEGSAEGERVTWHHTGTDGAIGGGMGRTVRNMTIERGGEARISCKDYRFSATVMVGVPEGGFRDLTFEAVQLRGQENTVSTYCTYTAGVGRVNASIDFGDGTVYDSRLMNRVMRIHTYDEPGTYIVECRAVDSVGNVIRDTQTIEIVSPAPRAELSSYDIVLVDRGETVDCEVRGDIPPEAIRFDIRRPNSGASISANKGGTPYEGYFEKEEYILGGVEHTVTCIGLYNPEGRIRKSFQVS